MPSPSPPDKEARDAYLQHCELSPVGCARVAASVVRGFNVLLPLTNAAYERRVTSCRTWSSSLHSFRLGGPQRNVKGNLDLVIQHHSTGVSLSLSSLSNAGTAVHFPILTILESKGFVLSLFASEMLNKKGMEIDEA